MIRFPLLDVALEGFRLTRERPATVLVWGGVLTLAQGITAAALVATGAGDALAAFNRVGASGAVDPTAAVNLLSAAAPGLMISGGVGLLVNAVIYAAVLRAVLEPQRRRAAFLRLGPDELRQLAVLLVLAAVAVFGLAILTPGLTLVIAPFLGATGATTTLAAPFVLALACAGISYPLVRLSLAPAATLAEGRLALRRAWPLTAGLFWPLLGANLLAACLGAVVAVLTQVLATSLWALGEGAGMAAAAVALQPDLRSVAGALTPGSLAAMVLGGVTTAFVLVILAAPGPAAYRALTGRSLTA